MDKLTNYGGEDKFDLSVLRASVQRKIDRLKNKIKKATSDEMVDVQNQLTEKRHYLL